MEPTKARVVEVREAMVERLPSAVTLLLLQGNAAVLEAGHGSPGNSVLVREGLKCVWVEEEGVPVSAVVVDIHQDVGMLWITLAYTRPEYRRRGHFARLHEALRVGARNAKCTHLGLGTHVTNEAMQGAAKRLGMEATFFRYVQKL